MPIPGRAVHLTLACLYVLGCGTRGPEPPEATAASTTSPPTVRAAACADDMWYPSTRDALTKRIDALLAKTKGPQPAGRIHAMISPHAGITYSGLAAAANYRLLPGQTYDRVIIMGPSHRVNFDGISVARFSHYETPLGRVPIDQPVVQDLLRHRPFSFQPEAHAREHSVEIQLPFLQRVLGPFKLVVLVMRRMHRADFARAADALRAHVTDKTLVIASSDFTHYGRRFGYAPFGKQWRRAVRRLDLTAAYHVQCQDADAFLDFCDRTGATICGRHPIGVLLELVKGRYNPMVLKYYTSADLCEDRTGSVSYLAMSFFDPPELTEANRRALMTVACTSLRAATDGKQAEAAPDEVATWDAALRTPAGVFVTLKQGHELRGCIGELVPQDMLGQAVYTRAYSAARNDSRFAKVSAKDLDGLTLTVSVLSPLRRIASHKGIRLGRDGVLLRKAGRQALYLPEVATEQGWDRPTMLSHLCHKAGLPRDAWKGDVRLYTFTTDRFSARYKDVSRAATGHTWDWVR